MPAGRKTKLNDETEEKMCAYLSCGLPVKDACNLALISERTYYRWIEQGIRAEAGRKHEFQQATTRAISLAVSKFVDIILAAAPKDWRAAAFILERRWPQEWGKRIQAEIIAERAKPISLKGLGSDELRAMKKILNNGNGRSPEVRKDSATRSTSRFSDN